MACEAMARRRRAGWLDQMRTEWDTSDWTSNCFHVGVDEPFNLRGGVVGCHPGSKGLVALVPFSCGGWASASWDMEMVLQGAFRTSWARSFSVHFPKEAELVDSTYPNSMFNNPA